MTKTQCFQAMSVMRVIALHPCTELEVCRSAPVEDMRHFPSQHYSASTFDLSKSKWARGHSCHVFLFCQFSLCYVLPPYWGREP